MKRFVIISVIAFLIISAVCFAPHTKLFWQIALTHVLEKHGYTVKKCTFGDFNLNGYTEATFKAVMLDISKAGREYDITAPGVHLIADKPLTKIVAEITDAAVKTDGFSLERLYTTLTAKRHGRKWAIEAPLKIKSAQAAGYHWSDISATLLTELSNVQIESIKSSFYNGQMQGKIVLESFETFEYSIDLTFKSVDLKSLSAANEAVFGQVSGVMDGQVMARIRGKRILDLNGNFDAPGGGEMRAVFLRFIMDYLPKNTQEQKMFAVMINENRMVPLNRFRVSLNRTSQDRTSVNFDLESRQLNLKPNITIDLNNSDAIGVYGIIQGLKAAMMKDFLGLEKQLKQFEVQSKGVK